MLGTVIAGKYRIVERIAAGGMGTVYKAEQQGLGRAVALKLLHPGSMEGVEDSTASRDDFAVLEKRFSREAAILAKLQHPNIVTVYDYGAVDEQADERAAADGRTSITDARPMARFYMVMELLGGQTLQQRLAERKVLAWDEAVRIFRQIARGLREAHAVGVVHRDLKPANVMLVRDRDGDEQVKLLDFGIGKIVDEPGSLPAPSPVTGETPASGEDELTRDGRFVGSPQYMSPEQVTGEGIDTRSDVYSFGVMLYRCLAGKNPFHRHSVTMIMLAHLNDVPAPLGVAAPEREIPAWLEDLVLRCLAKQKEARPQSMDEIVRALSDASVGMPISGRGSLVASRPLPESIAEPTLSEAAARSQMPTPHTAEPVLSRTYEPATPPPAPPRRTGLWVALVALAVGVAGLTAFLARKSTDGPAAASSSAVKPEAHFALVIESVPGGARVLENGKPIGVTPLQLDVDPAPLAKTPRTFVIVADGHQPYTLVQGPSTQAVRIVAALVPSAADAAPPPTTTTVASATTAPVPTAPKGPEIPKTAPPAKSASVAPPPPVDIILKR